MLDVAIIPSRLLTNYYKEFTNYFPFLFDNTIYFPEVQNKKTQRLGGFACHFPLHSQHHGMSVIQCAVLRTNIKGCQSYNYRNPSTCVIVAPTPYPTDIADSAEWDYYGIMNA